MSDNLYNEEKKSKDADPERWKEFMKMRKSQGPEWINTLIHATSTKGGNAGSGRATQAYNAMQKLDVLKQESSMTGSCQSKSFNARMYTQKLQQEWGWDPKDANEEWERLLAAADPDKIEHKPTKPGRKMEPWLYLRDKDLLIGSQGLAHSSEIHLQDKIKKTRKLQTSRVPKMD